MILKIELNENQFVKIHKMAQDTNSDADTIVSGIVGLFLNKKSNKILDNSKEKEFIDSIHKALNKYNGIREYRGCIERKLSDEHIQELLKMRQRGVSFTEIGKRLGVDKSTAAKAFKRISK